MNSVRGNFHCQIPCHVMVTFIGHGESGRSSNQLIRGDGSDERKSPVSNRIVSRCQVCILGMLSRLWRECRLNLAD